MRWVVEIPDPSGGTAATVTVEARSWLEGLTKARGGVALAKYHAEIDDDGLVRVLDRNTRDRFTVRPMKSIGPDAGRALSPAPEAPLLFSSPPPADPIFNTGESRAAPAPTSPPSPTSSSPPAAASTPPPGDKGTLLSHRAVYALGNSEPSQSLTGAHAAARGGRGGGPRRSPSSETPRVQIPAPQGNARKSPVPGATDSSPPGDRPSQPRVAEAPPSSVVALALDYASQSHEAPRPDAKPAEATPSRPELPPPPEPEATPSPAEPAVAQAPAEPATPPAPAEPAAPVPAAAAAQLAAAPDNNRSDTMVVPTVTAHDGIVEPLPVPTVLFERDEEPGPGHPIAYRERVFAVPAGTTRDRAEALARQSFAAIKRALSSRPRGRFVTIAVFDEEFTSRPSVPPLVVLEWKDWRGDPSVQYPDSLPPPEPEAPAVSAPPAPVEAPAPADAPASALATVVETPAPVEAPAPAPAAAEATVPATGEAERPKRARVPTESDISMVEVVPPPVPMAAIPSESDISMVEVVPPATPAAVAPAPPTPAPAPPQAAPAVVTPAAPSKAQDARGKKDKKRKRNRTSSESNISTTTARLASVAQTPQTPAERDAPTVVVPVYQAPDAKPAPEAAKPAPEEAAPTTPAAQETPAAEAAPASPTSAETPAAATPALAPEAPQAAPAPAAPEAPKEPAPEAPKEPAALAEAPATTVSLAKEPEAPAATPAPAAEPAPSVSLAKEPAEPAPSVSPAKEPEAPAKPAAEPAPEKPPVPTRSSALTAKRRRGKELVGDLFEALMDLSFTQTSEDACAFAARVLHEYVVCDGCSVALYDIDRDEFVVAASEGVSIVGDRDTAGRGSRTLAVRRKAAVNMKRGDAAEGLADFLAGGPSVFVPAFHRDRLFAMAVLQRMPGAPFFESDEEDGATYVTSQLAEALAAHSKRAGAKQLDDEHRASIAPKRR